ncbi:hypothetical protein K469DRAFT_684124 [Zopfia rhizophila CBS 207.26]|uniref:Uncharacterized protein n=1 Tax=Zopfia rhizophila CBS 207.26 TaxID=1314779 RepID=A0A6A6EA24_9PEZI|nr:hypothetical protein K469DRAFT_684124 [Zopfia rhizophila CBS 207.26]
MDRHLCHINTQEKRVNGLDSRVKGIDTEIQPGAFASARRDININKTCCEQLDKVAKRQYGDIKEVKGDLSLKADKSNYQKLRDEREVKQCQANAQATKDELNRRSDGLDKILDVFDKKLSQAQEIEKKHYANQNQALQTRTEQVEGRHRRLTTNLTTHTTQIGALKSEYQSFERKLRGDLKHNQETIKLQQGTLETAFTNYCGRLEGLTSQFDKFEISLQSKLSEVKQEAQESISQRVQQVPDMQKLEEKFDKEKASVGAAIHRINRALSNQPTLEALQRCINNSVATGLTAMSSAAATSPSAPFLHD